MSCNVSLWSIVLTLSVTSPLSAGFMFSGNHTLIANQQNQVINIFASPSSVGEIAAGLNLNLIIDDGGSIVGGEDNNSPKISSVNLKPFGGLFANIPDAQTNAFSSQKLYQVTIAPTSVANRPIITSNVLLAQVTLDTTGLTSGTWLLDLDGLVRPPNINLPASDFAGAAASITNGSLTISAVPEPSSLLTLTIFSATLMQIARMRQARKAACQELST